MIKLIYCSSVCSENTYEKLYSKSKFFPGQQVQKYHRTLLKGLSRLGKFDITAISKLQVQRSNIKKVFIKVKKENWQNVKIKYLFSVNIPVLNNIFQTINAFFSVLFTKKLESTFAIIDILNPSLNSGVILACKIKHIKIIGIVTDLPQLMNGDIVTRFTKVCNKHIDKCDGYVLLTEQMRDVVDPAHKKEYCVIEGQVDDDISFEETQKVNFEKKICMYTGGLSKLYGLDNLVEGFIEADIPNAELDIYGNGDYQDELQALCKEHKNVVYKGVKLNDEIVKLQKEAYLLINPRPTTESFVKYSFPSKNMEYMASGTPVLTTVLPGMPEEYHPYVYLLEEETSEGVCKKLMEIFSLDVCSHFRKGRKARDFVFRCKRGSIQSEKIFDMLIRIK